MPELPDVEVFKRYLDSNALHKKIQGVSILNIKILGNVTGKKLQESLIGREFSSTKRHGKHLFVEISGGDWLAMHFGMTGYLKYFKEKDEQPKYDRLQFDFSNGYHLGYYSKRLLGRVDWVENPDTIITASHLGPDLLAEDFNFKAFKEVLANSKGIIKSALMNQEHFAGLGNIYSDEILFQAGTHPKTKVDKLDEKALKILFNKLKSVLETAIECGADPGKLPKRYLIPQRKKGGQCPVCGTAIQQIKISARSAYICPICQGLSE